MLCLPLLFSFLSCLACTVHAQSQTFSWSVTTRFGECESVSIKLAPLTQTSSFDGVGPFYMISYELGGIATIDFLGTDWQNLTWVVRHPQGAQVFLNVVGSLGSSGGILNGVVQGGAASDCRPAKPTSPMKVTADLPQVATCDSVNATITGGRAPYTISIVSTTNYRSPSNFTIGEDDDIFTYVNKVAPGDSFIITASDSTCQWAYGMNFILSVGSPNTSCPGKQSFGSRSANLTQTTDTTNTSNENVESHSQTLGDVAIAGIIAGGITLLISAALATYFFVRRRKNLSSTNRSVFPLNGDVTPFISPPGSRSASQMGQSGARLSTTANTIDYSNVPLLRTPHPPSRTPRPAADPNEAIQLETLYGHYLDPFAASGIDSRRTSKNSTLSVETSALLLPQNPEPQNRSDAILHPVALQVPPTISAKQRLSDQAARERGGRTAMIQHQDAEDLLEVPPAYQERSGPSRSTQN